MKNHLMKCYKCGCICGKVTDSKLCYKCENLVNTKIDIPVNDMHPIFKDINTSFGMM